MDPHRSRQRSHAGFLLCAVVSSWALFLCASCSHAHGGDFGRLPAITSPDPKAESELQQARTLGDRGHSDEAAAHYAAFITRHPGDPLVPVAELELGRILLMQGKASEASPWLERVAKQPDAALAEQGRFYGAIAAHRLGNHLAAVEVLQPMVGRPIDPADTRLLLRTLAEALIALSRHGEAIVAMDALTAPSLPEADRVWAQAQLTEVVRDKASAADIERLFRELTHSGFAWPLVLRRALRDADAAGRSDRARELLDVLRAEELPMDAELGAIAMRAERPAEANPQVVGAVLSLSGRGRQVGELALRGLMLAAGLPPSGPQAADAPQLVFRDDGGDPQRAADAVSDLVTVHRAIAIIGPIDIHAAEAAAARAQQLGVPIVLLSPGGKPTDLGPMVYRLFATPSTEVQALISRAKAIDRGQIAALLPVGAYGDLMERTLREQAKTLGAPITEVMRYPQGATTFVAEAAALALKPFETLVLADAASQIALIAPALASAGLWCTPPGDIPKDGGRSITVMAPSVAFDHELAKSAGRFLQGAIFSVPFDAATAQGVGAQFVQRFEAQFGDPPDAFAVFAHDAYKLVRKAVDAGNKTRSALAEQLWQTQSSDLAGPSAGLLPDREAQRATRLLLLAGEHFVPAP